MDTSPIVIETTVKAPLATVWDCWTQPEHITQWAFADNTWEAPSAENDLKVGGRFKTEMAAKDKSGGFDFTGVYTEVKEHALVEYNIDDGRHVKVEFSEVPEGTKIIQSFEPEGQHSRDFQKAGWQGFLNNFKKHVESH